MFEDIKTVDELNAARGKASRELTKMYGNDERDEWKKQQDIVDHAYEKRIHELWDEADHAMWNAAIAAAQALGFSHNQYKTGPLIDDTMQKYSALTMAGLPVRSPEAYAALDDINHVSRVLSDAMDAYEHLNS